MSSTKDKFALLGRKLIEYITSWFLKCFLVSWKSIVKEEIVSDTSILNPMIHVYTQIIESWTKNLLKDIYFKDKMFVFLLMAGVKMKKQFSCLWLYCQICLVNLHTAYDLTRYTRTSFSTSEKIFEKKSIRINLSSPSITSLHSLKLLSYCVLTDDRLVFLRTSAWG